MTAPNTTDGHAAPDELIRLFIEEATRGLTSLPVTPPLRCTSIVRHADNTGWLDAPSSQRSNWFEVTVAFSSDALEGAFRFGERENAIWADARRAGSDGDFGLWEWSAVLGRAPSPWEGGDWVYEPERLRTIVWALTEALRELHDEIARADSGTHALLDAARVARSAVDAESARLREQERDEVQAAAAFRSGDYATAVKLLSKHLAHLSPAQQRKLALAQTKVP